MVQDIQICVHKLLQNVYKLIDLPTFFFQNCSDESFPDPYVEIKDEDWQWKMAEVTSLLDRMWWQC